MTGRTLRSKRRAVDGEEDKSQKAESSKENSRSDKRKVVKIVSERIILLENNDTPFVSIKEIKRRLEDLSSLQDGDEEGLKRYILQLENDPRAGVIALLANVRDSRYRQEVEEERLKTMMEYETEAFSRYMKRQESIDATGKAMKRKGKRKTSIEKNQHYLIGVDEVGVGPLAGPIVSCAVAFKYTTLLRILPLLKGIDDSKKLSAIKRESLAEVIRQYCIDHQFGIVTSTEVDELNPLQGSLIAMKRAVLALKIPSSSKENHPSIDVFVDHHTIPELNSDVYRQTSITKGDSKSVVVAAASILAKVYRDEYMDRLHQEYPQFAFDRNAGYGTKDHLIQLRKGLLCPEHRLSYEPVRQAKRISMGLPPDASPKKKTRANSRSVSPTKVVRTRSKPSIGSVSTAEVIETGSPAAMNPGIFSLSWWTSLLSSTSPAQ
jgi:ribonuclease HII